MERDKTRRQVLKYGTGIGMLATFTPRSVSAEEISSANPPTNDLSLGRTQSVTTQAGGAENDAAEALIVRECSSWGVYANETVLEELDTDFAVIGSDTLASTDLDQYSTVVLPSTQSAKYYQDLADSSSKLETFVENGGTLVAHVTDAGYPCSASWDATFVPGGLGHETTLQDQLTLSAESHPIYENVSDAALDGWNYSTHGYLTDVPAGATTLVSNASGNPTHVEYGVGSGTVIATMQTLEWPFGSDYGTKEVLRNELEYALGESAVAQPVNTRLVQTVENTRIDESTGVTLADDEISTTNENAPDTPDADLVIGRGTAVVFDIEIENTDMYTGDLGITISRDYLHRSTEEETFSLSGSDALSAAGGNLLSNIESRYVDPDIEDIPVFKLDDGLKSVTVSLEPEDDSIEGRSDTIDIPGDVRDGVDVVSMPQLNIGFISVDNSSIEYGRIGENEYDDVQPRPFNAYTNFVEEAAEYIQRIFPTAKVNVYKQKYPEGILGGVTNPDRELSKPINKKGLQRIDAQRARQELDDKLPIDSSDTPSDGEVFEVLNGSVEESTGTEFKIEEFDVTIAVTPSEYFEFNENDSSKTGVHYTGPTLTSDDPLTQPPKSAIVEYNNVTTAAHEAGHHFLNHPFDDDLVQDPGDEAHPTDELVSTQYDLEDGSFDVNADAPSFMSYSSSRWMDSFSKQILLENDFEPVPEEGSEFEGFIQGISMAGEITSDGVIVQDIQSGNITAVTDVDGASGTINVRDASDETLSEYTIPTEFTYDEQESGDTGTVSNVFSASFPLPDEAVEVVIEAPDPDGSGTVRTNQNLVTAPLRRDIGSLPEDAFIADAQGIKGSLANRLDNLAKHTENGRFGPATNVAESIRQTLDKQLLDSYETTAARQLTKEEIIGTLDERIEQLASLTEQNDQSGGNGGQGNGGQGNGGRGNRGRGN